MNTVPSINDLPGADIIHEGLQDLENGRTTVVACLVSVARRRLAAAGIPFPAHAPLIAQPERQLYQLLVREPGNAYSRYNSLIRRLVRFSHSLDHLNARSS